MNLLFWNLYNKNNSKYIADILEENNIDIAIFSEYNSVDFSKLKAEIENVYSIHMGMGGCEKVFMIAKNDFSIVISREHTRYTLYICEYLNQKYIIAGIHLPSNPTSNADSRKIIIRDIVKDIVELENKSKIDNTIVIGDFNASPFDDELVEKDAFNAVMYKDIINAHEFVTYAGKKFKRFYNPILNYISEENKTYGSYYYTSTINSLYWFCYDQVIVRKPLVDLVKNVSYCKQIKEKSLMSQVKPNQNISDHLPLLVELKVR